MAKPWQKLRDKLDWLFAQRIRARGRCADDRPDHTCNGNLQCAHGFSRGYYAIRWDPRNAFCLCARSHVYYTAHPIEWEDFMRRALGVEVYQELRMLAQQGKRPRQDEMEQMVKEFEENLLVPI